MGNFKEVLPINLTILNMINQLIKLDHLELSKLFLSILILGAKQVLALAKFRKLQTRIMLLTQRYSLTI